MCLGTVCWREYIGLSEDLIVNSLIAAPPSGHHKSCIYLIYERQCSRRQIKHSYKISNLDPTTI